jgi:hypothetical protein
MSLAVLTQAQLGQLSLWQTAGQHLKTGLIAPYDPRNDPPPVLRNEMKSARSLVDFIGSRDVDEPQNVEATPVDRLRQVRVSA